jgi:hypothetical protein
VENARVDGGDDDLGVRLLRDPDERLATELEVVEAERAAGEADAEDAVVDAARLGSGQSSGSIEFGQHEDRFVERAVSLAERRRRDDDAVRLADRSLVLSAEVGLAREAEG